MTNIIIIGAGYGGLRAVELLCKHQKFHITLIDKNPYHYMQTEAYGYIAGRFDLSDIAIDLATFAQGLGNNVTYIQDNALHLDCDKQTVHCEKQDIDYDYLIIAVGAQTNFFPFIKGLKENTHGVKNIQRALEFRQSFEYRLSLKLQNKKLQRNGDLHIAIAGAGLSGVEIAAEMAYTLKKFEKILSQNSKTLHISLIDGADTILPGMDNYIIKKTEKRLKNLGVKIYTNAFISKIEPRVIHFQDQTSLDFDFLIFTAGIKAVKFVDQIDTPKNKQNQIITDAYLRLQNYTNVFAIGDCAQITDAQGTILPPTAQVAEKSAAYVVNTIVKLAKNQSITPFHTKIDGIFVALGGEYAIGMLYNTIKLEGYIAYLLKKFITRTYRLGLELKVNAGYKKRYT